MRYFYTLSLIMLLSFTSFSQGYFKDYLAHQISKAEQDEFPVVIKFKSQVDIQTLKSDLVKQGLSIDERRKIITNTLFDHNKTPETFSNLIQSINASDYNAIKDVKTYWVVNAMSCKASIEALNILVESPDVDFIQYDLPTKAAKVISKDAPQNRSVGGAEQGLIEINARGLWALGYTGRNRIAMNIDTGVNIEHACLNDRFLGHFLPLSQCWLGFENPYPYDIDRSSFHGTHTLGTMIGLDVANADTVGLAFNAVWISTDPIVTNHENIRPMSDYYIAFEWAINPDGDLNTSNDIPDVINNSWGVENTMWPDCDPIEYSFIEALEAADCSVIFSAGNEGPGDGTTGMPAGITKDSLNIFSVGALDANDTNYDIASFSSRGPSHCDPVTSVGIKPEVSAPGVDVRSCANTGQYKLLSGTSMAGPHVSGAVLLLREAFPNITSTELKNALYQTAIDLGDPGEDNTYGRGLIDVMAAYNFLTQTHTPTPPVTNQYDLAITDITGNTKITCEEANTYQVHIENRGTDAITDIFFRLVLNGDTLIENTLNITLNGGETHTETVNINITEFTNDLIVEVNKAGIEEYNIYNNFRTIEIKRLTSNSIPYYEDFENIDSDLGNSNFAFYNPDFQNTWRVDSTEGIVDSYKSLRMPFAYYEPRAGQLDYLITSSFDIPATGNTYLYFKHAYTQYFNSRKDSLFILASDVCDLDSGTRIFEEGGSSLKTASSNLVGDYVPTDASEWHDNEINLTAYAGQTILLKFIARNDQSNNLYIDELRIENGLDLSAGSLVKNELKFYPNPTSSEVHFSESSENKLVDFYDIRGKKVLSRKVTQATIDVSSLANGVYFLRNSEAKIGKLIIQK